MKRRTIVRIISFASAVAVASIIFCVKAEMKTRRYSLAVKAGYSHSFDELETSVNNISDILNKARFVTTPSQISEMSSRLLTEAELSKNALSQLPINGELTSLNRFFSQVGNYAMSVSKKLIDGEKISDKDTANIEALSMVAERIAKIVNDSYMNYNNMEYWASEVESKLDDTVKKNLNTSLGATEDEFKDYPTLIYDGPYSNHIIDKEPSLLKDKSEVDEDLAKLTAAKFAETGITELKNTEKTGGKIPCYRFWGEKVSVSVTKSGGYVMYMRKEKDISDIVLSYEQSLEKAKRYLSKMGINGMTETYYFESDGICTINFAFLDGATVCYTDLIKVGVAMDDGTIMTFEAGGYISNHKDRAFETPVITEQQAEEIISPKLTVEEIKLALIPTDSVKEIRCYEFRCTSADGQNVLVYINTATLREEEILILLKSDGGILAK